MQPTSAEIVKYVKSIQNTPDAPSLLGSVPSCASTTQWTDTEIRNFMLAIYTSIGQVEASLDAQQRDNPTPMWSKPGGINLFGGGMFQTCS